MNNFIDNASDTSRPRLTFDSITFSGGQTLKLEADEIIVFVGPNNAGKSGSLRELNQWVGRSVPQKIITAASLRKVGDASSLGSYLERHAQKRGSVGQVQYTVWDMVSQPTP
jgi:ABC-type Mn2+/Zn2+ transport system ATPase subunit